MRHKPDERIDLCGSLPFLFMRFACLLVIWTGVSAVAVAVCLAMYGLRMFSITGGYHAIFRTVAIKPAGLFNSRWAALGRWPPRKGQCGGRLIIGGAMDIPIPQTTYTRRWLADSGGHTSGGFSAANTMILTSG